MFQNWLKKRNSVGASSSAPGAMGGGMPLVMEVPEYHEERILERQAREVRGEPHIDWQQYMEADLITHDDYIFITSYQNTNTKEERDAVLKRFEDKALHSLISVVQSVCVVGEIKKFLVLLDDMLREDMSRVFYFTTGETEPWQPLLDLLRCNDEFVCNISSLIIARMLQMKRYGSDSEDDLKFYFKWLKGELRRDNQYLLTVISCLQKILQVGQFKQIFWSINGIFRITRMLNSGVRLQAQYQLVFCLWLASYDSEIAMKMTRFNAIPVLVEMMIRAPSEIIKLPRIVLATLRNFIEMPKDEETRKENAHTMIECKMFRYLNILKKEMPSIEDIEFQEDYEALDELLTRYVTEMSTFDSYVLELRSGNLDWSVVHTSKQFWEECAERLNENEHELLKILISLLEVPDKHDTKAACVATHDLNMYMRYYPRGRRNVQNMGGKEALVQLLELDQPKVRYHALKCLQILMLNTDSLLEQFISDCQLTAYMEWKTTDDDPEVKRTKSVD